MKRISALSFGRALCLGPTPSSAQEEWASEAEFGRAFKCQDRWAPEAKTACVSPSLWATDLEREGTPGHMLTGDPRMRPPWTSKGVATKDTKPTPLQ